MTCIKKLLVLVLLVVFAMPIVGCGVGTTPADHRRAFRRTVDDDARMMVDDIHLLLQIERPFRGSSWVID